MAGRDDARIGSTSIPVRLRMLACRSSIPVLMSPAAHLTAAQSGCNCPINPAAFLEIALHSEVAIKKKFCVEQHTGACRIRTKQHGIRELYLIWQERPQHHACPADASPALAGPAA